MQVNLPSVVSEINEEFDRYEHALVTNDVAALDAFFWRDPCALRYGVAENLYGHEEIAAFRAARSPDGLARTITRRVITTFGTDYATTNIEFQRGHSKRIGRQSQTWVRLPEGWRIVNAHVSLMMDS
jgi:hypothetical protein